MFARRLARLFGPRTVAALARATKEPFRRRLEFESSSSSSRSAFGSAAAIGAAVALASDSRGRIDEFDAARIGWSDEIRRRFGAERGKTAPDARHPLGWTALMAAAANGRADAARTLLELGARPDLRDEYSGAGSVAAARGLDPSEVRETRELRFSPYLDGRATCSGFTALHYASLIDSEDVVAVLLEADADPNARDDAGRTPLDYARKRSAVHRMLLESGKKREALEALKERKRFPLEQRLRSRIVGQRTAIDTVASAIRRKENGWADDDHPLVFLFLGSSGIGKTELAKQLARYSHKDDPNGFVRIDMSEYQTKHEVAKLIGAPPGYVGHEDGGQLTRHLAKRKDAVVLFDEVDKAHPDVLTVLLQLFDEGRLTDGKGRSIECKDAIFVMTSNLASDEIARYGIKLREEADAAAKKEKDSNATEVEGENLTVSKHFKDKVVRPILKRHFERDEFLGRINEIVYFLPFSRQELLALVTMELNLWADRAKSRHNVELKWESGVLGCLADGYDVYYGARSIKYEVERRVINKIALASEKENLVKDSSVLVVNDDKGNINILIKKKGEISYSPIV